MLVNTYAKKGFIFLEKSDEKKIVLPENLQKEILKFFLKTSIPRIAKEKRKNKALPKGDGEEIK